MTLVSMFLVYPGYSFFQKLSAKRHEIPVSARQWHHRLFWYWNDYAALLYGDFIFLSLLNGFVAVSLYTNSVPIEWFAIAITFGCVITVMWLRIMKSAFNVKSIAGRWDWSFVPPHARITLGGKYHLFYFVVEASIVALSVYFLWAPVSAVISLGIILSLLGYLSTVMYDTAREGWLLNKKHD